MPDSVLGKIAVEIGGGTAANGGGGGSPSSTSISGGGGDAEVKKQSALLGGMREHLGKITKNSSGEPRFWTKAFKTMGIQVGLAGILKQSQVFTSTLGSFFQIMGAFVDVILAPWLPLIMPLMRNLANKIPWFKKKSEQAYKWMTETFVPWLMKVGGKIKDGIKNVVDWTTSFFSFMFSPDEWAPKFTELITKLKSWWQEIEWGETIKALADGIKDMLGLLWDKILGGRIVPLLDWTIPRFGKEVAKNTDPNTNDEGSFLERARQNPIGTGKDILAEIENLGEEFQNAGWKEQGAALAAISASSAAAAKTLTSIKLKNIPIEMNPLRYAPGSGVAKAMLKTFGMPAELAAKAAITVTKKAATTGINLAGNLQKGPKTPGGLNVQRMMDMGFDEEDFADMGKGANKTIGQQMKNLQKTQGIIDFSKYSGVVDEGAEAGGGGIRKAAQPVMTAAQKISVEAYRKAISTAEEFRGWLANVKPGESNLVQKANARMKVLWGAFGKIAHLPGGAAMRPAFSFLTRFAKFLIPGLATTFVVRETQYEINKMMQSDMPWLKDPGNIESWAADAGVIGSGAAAGYTSAGQGGIAQLLGIGPYGIDKEMGQTSKLYMEAQAAHFQQGALSQGKLAPILMRLLGGGLEAGGSLFGAPGIAVSGTGFTMSELARQRMGLGLGTGQGYAEEQMMNDLRMLMPGWGNQKVTIDGMPSESSISVP